MVRGFFMLSSRSPRLYIFGETAICLYQAFKGV